MKKILKKFKQLSLCSMVLFISFVTNSCDENKDLTTESVDKTGTYTEKADLTELINKIGDRDLKLIELIKKNPISMFKTALYQKTKTSSSEYYFDTDNIMSLKDNNNHAVYIIPAYKSSNARDSNIYSISININDDFIDTKLNILQLKEDGTQEYISRDFVYSSSTSKTSKVKDIECYCTVYIIGGVSNATGWYYPETPVMYCSECSGGSDFGMGSSPNTGGSITLATVWASSGGGSNYGYAYITDGQMAHIALLKMFRPADNTHFNFTSFQQAAITGNLKISNDLIDFLNTDGKTQSNKNFVISILDGIEAGTVNSYEEFRVLLNAYKQAQAFLAFKNSYFTEHPNTTAEQFENWFATPREGKDGDYDATYWDNANLTFPQQSLPSFSSFDIAYPRTSGAELAQLIGGDVLQLYNQYPSIVRGFCALKISRGLNYSGVTIPYIVTTNGNPGTVLGSDGKYYFLNAKALNKWMQKTFGISPSNPNHIRISGSQGGLNGKNFPYLTTGIKGIYSMVSTNSQWATGHADLINNGACIFGCHFYDIPPAPIDYIDIWILN